MSWQKPELKYTLRTYRPGLRGVWDHLLDVTTGKDRRIAEDYTVSVYVKVGENEKAYLRDATLSPSK